MPSTDAAVRSVKLKAGAYKLSDTGGLFLLVSPAGGKLWRMKFLHQGKEQLLSFGSYPDGSLADARAIPPCRTARITRPCLLYTYRTML
jgi:hypothetical protein